MDMAIVAEHAYMEHSIDLGSFETIYANSAMAYKIGEHDIDPQSYKEA